MNVVINGGKRFFKLIIINNTSKLTIFKNNTKMMVIIVWILSSVCIHYKHLTPIFNSNQIALNTIVILSFTFLSQTFYLWFYFVYVQIVDSWCVYNVRDSLIIVIFITFSLFLCVEQLNLRLCTARGILHGSVFWTSILYILMY